jgi:hypothetical protein
MEEFVSGESVRDWWNHGSSDDKNLWMYSFFAHQTIPGRLSKIKASKWFLDIHEMLKQIPGAIEASKQEKYGEVITSKLATYENLRDVATFLELGLWKSKILEHHADPASARDLCDVTKAEHRLNCGASIIIPNVLSFLLTTGEKVGESDEEESDDDETHEEYPFHPMVFGDGFFAMFYGAFEGSSEED